MTTDTPYEILPAQSRAARYRDYVCAAVLLGPLVLLAFQGDILLGLAERSNYGGQYTELHSREAELTQVKAALAQIAAARQTLDFRLPDNQEARRSLALREANLRRQQENLERQVKSRRKPLEDRAAYWNFSFVQHWPLVLLVGPLLLAIAWLGTSPEERRRLYHEALLTGARHRGLLLALLAMTLFWLGVWQQSALASDLLEHQGTPGYTPAFGQRYAFILDYVSLAGWSAAALYAFTGLGGLRRLWLPLALIMTLLILNYGRMSGSWAYMWDKKAQWSYGYLVGPIAAALYYYKLTEPDAHPARDPGRALLLMAAGVVGLLLAGGLYLLAGGIGNVAAMFMICFLGAASLVPLVAGVVRLVREHADLTLLVWGLAGILGALAIWVAARQIGRGAPVLYFLPVPLAACAALLGLGAWQLLDRQKRGDLAMRLAGLAVLLASAAFYALALSKPIRYFAEISLVGVLLGGTLAVFGYQMLRVTWVAMAFLYLGIPWPERAYVELASRPQTWAAEMAVRVLQLIYGVSVRRDGNVIIAGPTDEDRLEVAQQCSGLQMLFAFVALSVVYAYISKRPAWRRVVIFISSFPIAVAANFARVTIMALAYRMGFRQITQGLGHEMAGFVIMLPLAFALLYLEMRALDLLEKVFAGLTEEDAAAGGAGRATAKSSEK